MNVKIPEAVDSLTITALKAVVSDYAIRAKQAEEMCSTLLNEKIGELQLLPMITSLMTDHTESKAKEKAIHQQAVIQSILFTLESSRNLPELELRNAVNKLVRIVIMSNGHMM